MSVSNLDENAASSGQLTSLLDPSCVGFEVFQSLPVRDLVRVGCVNKECHQVALKVLLDIKYIESKIKERNFNERLDLLRAAHSLPLSPDYKDQAFSKMLEIFKRLIGLNVMSGLPVVASISVFKFFRDFPEDRVRHLFAYLADSARVLFQVVGSRPSKEIVLFAQELIMAHKYDFAEKVIAPGFDHFPEDIKASILCLLLEHNQVGLVERLLFQNENNLYFLEGVCLIDILIYLLDYSENNREFLERFISEIKKVNFPLEGFLLSVINTLSLEAFRMCLELFEPHRYELEKLLPHVAREERNDHFRVLVKFYLKINPLEKGDDFLLQGVMKMSLPAQISWVIDTYKELIFSRFTHCELSTYVEHLISRNEIGLARQVYEMSKNSWFFRAKDRVRQLIDKNEREFACQIARDEFKRSYRVVDLIEIYESFYCDRPESEIYGKLYLSFKDIHDQVPDHLRPRFGEDLYNQLKENGKMAFSENSRIEVRFGEHAFKLPVARIKQCLAIPEQQIKRRQLK